MVDDLFWRSFVVTFVVTLFSTPLIRTLALRFGAVDIPDSRKVHQQAMPLWGGLAIYAGFLTSFVWFLPKDEIGVGVVMGSTMMIALGALDDKYDLKPNTKVFVQVLAALVLIAFGFEVQMIHFPLNEPWVLGWLAIPLTIVWIVGVTNAINLLDGLDGLAAGVSAIACASIMMIALIQGNEEVALYCVVLIGAILAFLCFNFYPARIFMGDTGALFLGFNLAALSILGYKQVTLFSFIIPLMILGVPLADTFFAIWRRLAGGRPLFLADDLHIHHRLLRLGYSERTSVLFIYGVSLVFGLMAILLISGTWGLNVVVTFGVILMIQLGGEFVGMIHLKALFFKGNDP